MHGYRFGLTVTEALRPRQEGPSGPRSCLLRIHTVPFQTTLSTWSLRISCPNSPLACFPGPLPEGWGYRSQWLWANLDHEDSRVLVYVPGISCFEGGADLLRRGPGGRTRQLGCSPSPTTFWGRIPSLGILSLPGHQEGAEIKVELIEILARMVTCKLADVDPSALALQLWPCGCRGGPASSVPSAFTSRVQGPLLDTPGMSGEQRAGNQGPGELS